MKIVLDTNVVFSGIFFGGHPAKILEDVLESKYQLILSEDIIEEYLEVLQRRARKTQSPAEFAKNFVNQLISDAFLVESLNVQTPTCADPDDIKFLQAAIIGNAQFLISGDKHLLDVGKYKGGIVLKPKEFLLSK